MLQKQTVPLNFNGGLDTKSDPWQVQIGKFLELENSIFNINGRLQKRDGFQILGTTNDSTVNQITTYNDDILAVGNSIYAFNQSNGSFVNKGSFYPATLSVLPSVTSSYNVIDSDAAKSLNGLICTSFQVGSVNGTLYQYTIQNAQTGQIIVNPTNLPSVAGSVVTSGKVKFFNNRFVVVYVSFDGTNYYLQYITINQTSLVQTAPVQIANNVLALSSYKFFDFTVANDKIFVAYNTASSGGCRAAVITSSFTVTASVQINTVQADIVSGCNDGTNAYFVHYQNSTGNAQVVGISESGGVVSVLSGFPKQWLLTKFTGNTTSLSNTVTGIASTANIFSGIQVESDTVGPYLNVPDGEPLSVTTIASPSSVTLNWTPANTVTGAAFNLYSVSNLAVEVVGTSITMLAEIINPYPYIPNIINTVSPFNNLVPNVNTNLIYKKTCTTAGVVGTSPSSPLLRGMGLYSNCFKINTDIYFVSAYSRGNSSTLYPYPTLQPTYFVFDINGNVIASLAYRNGSGYNDLLLKSVSVDSFIGTTTIGSNLVTNVSNALQLQVGQRIISSAFPATDTYISSIVGSTSVQLSRSATTSGTTTLYSNEAFFSYSKIIDSEPITLGTLPSGSPFTYLQYTYGAYTNKLELYSQKTNFAELSQNVMCSGGFLWNYDGSKATENNFFIHPDTVVANPVYPSVDTTSSPGLDVDKYTYAVIYEWTDNQGNVNKSATGECEFEVKAESNFTGNTTNGSNRILNVTNIDKLQPGQRFTGAGFTTGVYIVSIDANTATTKQITVSQFATATGTSVAFTMSASQRVLGVNICVPTLRVGYKTVDTKIWIYRYSATKQTFYKLPYVGTQVSKSNNVVNKDFIFFKDNFANSQLVGNDILYVNGGSQVENIGPPSGKSLTIFDGRLWFIDSENPNQIWYSKQSIQNVPVEMSSLFSLYISPTQSSQGSTGPVRCLFPMDDKLIIFKDNAIYYINGSGPDNSGANSQYSQPILITSTVGCSNQRSIVFMQNGLMFQSNKGVWLLGRDLSTNYIGVDVERTTDDFLVTSAQLIPGTTEVRMALNDGTTLMYDYFYKQWSQFTGMSNISSIITNKLHTYLNNSGQIRRQTKGQYLDGTDPILMRFRTAWFSMAGLQGFQRAYFLFLLGRYISPHRINLSIAYDFNPASTQSVTIVPVNFTSGLLDTSDVEKWRIMLTNQKCETLQMIFQELQDSLTAGEGLELSELSAVVGLKKGYRTQNQFTTIG